MFKSNSEIKSGALISYVTTILSIIAGLIYTPWMIREIGKSDYGLYVLVGSFLTYFVMDFGLGEAIARFISKYRVRNKDHKVNQLLGLTSRLYLYINLVLFVVLVIVYFMIEIIFKELTPEEVVKFKVVYIIAGLYSLIRFPFLPVNAVLISYERFVFLKSCEIINKFGAIIIMSIALLLGFKLYALVAINAFTGIVVVLLKLYYLKNNTSVRVEFNYRNSLLRKQIFDFSAWVTVIRVAERLLLNIAPTLLAIFSGTTAIAIFSIGNIIEGYVWFFANALNGLFLSKVTSLKSTPKSRKSVTDLMIKVGRLQLLVIGLLYVGIISVGKDFILLLFGTDFNDSYPVVVLLVVPGSIILTQQIASTLMFVENKIKYIGIIHLISSLFSIGLSILLIPSYGAIGVAIGIFTAMILFQIIAMNIVYFKIMKINIFRFFKECHLKMAVPLLLSLFLGFGTDYVIPAPNFIIFLIKVGIIGVSYLLFMWLLALNNDEKTLITGIIEKIMQIRKNKNET